ncbi:MAG: carbon storage regulator CsrA [Gammaproteobacteria bacterium]|nr:carbon storage regulator CsrA [Gammaproteobacteria bacterium]
MLILTRRSNERIFIGDNIVLSILAIEGNRVKLGIDAPKDVAILREEIRGVAIEPEQTVPEPLQLKASGES